MQPNHSDATLSPHEQATAPSIAQPNAVPIAVEPSAEHSFTSSSSSAAASAAIEAAPTPTITLPAATVTQLTDILAQHVKEQRRGRLWKYAFRALLVGLFVLAVLWPLLRGGSSNHDSATKHVAVVKLEGTIEYGSSAGAEPMMSALQAAFEDSSSVAVVLQMNSPGGSPVQSAMIYDEINRLRAKFDKPIYAVVEEICASGCYYVAAATDEIYVNPASLVGSIGVIMEGFGATELMKKLGIERRMYTAGSNKGMLDPFSPAKPKHKAIVDAMLADVHEQFITAVKEGRGESLDVSKDPEVFSGRIYTGKQSVTLGLADELGGLNYLARDVIGVENLVDYSPKENIAERVAKKLGASFGAGAMQSLFKANQLGNIQ
jgi:protease IV